jgi:putative flippase GtrA
MKIKKEVIRYLIVTPFIGATDIGIYYLLIHFQAPYSVSKAISYIIANSISFLFSKYWIFTRKKKEASVPEAGRYLIVDVVLFVFNIIANQTVLTISSHAVFLSFVTASLVTALLSFTCNKFLVFKSSSV